MNVSESLLHLPARKPSMEGLASLDQQARDDFSAELLEALWDVYEAGDLPSSIAAVLRDWVAHAHFEGSPVVQERLADARRRASKTA